MSAILEKEYKFFLDHLDGLLRRHLHKFILIKDNRIAGFYDSYAEALRAGLKDFGNVPFFIKEIERHEEVHFPPAVPSRRQEIPWKRRMCAH